MCPCSKVYIYLKNISDAKILKGSVSIYIYIYICTFSIFKIFFLQTSKLKKQDSLFENVYQFSHCKKRQTSVVAPVVHVIFMRCFQGRLQVKNPLTHPTHTHTHTHIPAHLHIHLFSKHPTIFLTLLWHESAAIYFGNHPLIFPQVLLYTHTHTHTHTFTNRYNRASFVLENLDLELDCKHWPFLQGHKLWNKLLFDCLWHQQP